MSQAEREFNLSGIDRFLGKDWRNRCDYCGWPLAESRAKGCVEDDCSQRPRPLAMTSEAAQEIRQMEKALDAIAAHACKWADQGTTCRESGSAVFCTSCIARRALRKLYGNS